MIRFLTTLVLIAFLAKAAVADAPLGGLIGGAAFAPSPPHSDPIPLRRVVLPADTLPPSAGGPWVTLPRSEFEARVRAAANAIQTSPPRIVASHFTATFANSQLKGTAVLTVTGEGTLPLDPLAMSITSAKWDDDLDAVLFRQSQTKLLVNRSGTLRFDWSLKGREEPGEVRLELQVPAVPLAMLDLDLPADRTVTSQEALVTGPEPSPAAGLSRWRIAFGGKSKFDLVVRAANSLRNATARGNRIAKYDLAAGTANATFEFDLEALRGPVNAWIFTLDPGVRILDVITLNRDPWRIAAATEETPSTLTIPLREPATSGRVTITASVSMPGIGETWPCPGVHVLGPVGDDALELRLNSEVKLDSWEPGDYTFTKSTPLADRGYSLGFQGSWRHQATSPRRMLPTLRLRTGTAEVTSRETLDWKLSADKNHLTALMRVTVTRGPIVQFPITLPADYTLSSIRTTPDDPAAVWTPRGNNVWLLEPSRPWSTGNVIDVKLELRGLSPAKGPLPIPKVMSSLSATRTGTLAIALSNDVKGTLTQFGVKTEGRQFALPVTNREETTLSFAMAPMSPAMSADRLTSEESISTVSGLKLIYHIENNGEVTAVLTGIANGPELLNSFQFEGSVKSVLVAGKWTAFNSKGIVRLPATRDVSFEIRFDCSRLIGWPGSPSSKHFTGEIIWTSAGRYRFWPTLATTTTEPSPSIVDLRFVIVAGSLLVAVGITILWLLVQKLKRVTAAFKLKQIPKVSAVVLIACGGFTLHSADDPATVYLRADGKDFTVFTTPAVLQRLDAIATGSHPGAVISSASITGREDGDQIHFEATLTVNVLREGEQTLLLPLKGVPLEAVSLDNVAGLPEAKGERYAIAITGLGSHRVTVRWQVPVTATGSDREVKFALEDVPSAELNLTLSPAARQVTAPTRLGAQQSERDAEAATLSADLGAVSPVVIRWRVGTAANRPVRVTATELTLWDLTSSDSAVLTAFQVRVDDGSLTRLNFKVPAGLDATRIQIRTPDGNLLGIRDWRITANEVGVLLRDPLEGPASITLRLVPTVPLTLSPNLVPVRLTSANTVTATYLAVRCGNTNVHRWDRTACNEVPVEGLVKNFATFTDLTLERLLPVKAYRCESDASVKVLIHAASLAEPQREEFAFRIGTKATVDGALKWNRDAVSLVEFDVPAAITISEMKATEMAGWSRTGNRVRLWLRSPQRDLTVTWHGTWPGASAKTSTVELPVAAKVSRIVRVTPADGVIVTAMPSKSWQSGVTLRNGQLLWIGTAVGPAAKVTVTRP
ncbi:hypothetical protein BH11PLA2_BH11PLA2_22000 [soil metagenome]